MNCHLGDQILSRLFEKVARPGRYLDNEINLRRDTRGRLKVLLCFPDLYEIGMSHLGLRILYHVLNRDPEHQADLAFAPWVDMEEFMRREAIPLFGIGTGVPAREFDALGFSLQHELQYTNVLNMLDLAGIPVLAEDRADCDPVVIAGGPCAFNPEPMVDFIDAFAIGDGETVIAEIAKRLADAKARGIGRAGKLEMLAGIEGIYVPRIDGPRPAAKVSRRIEPVLKDEDFPFPPIVPIIPITHDRLTLEIMRGCTRGCRFCSAGMLTRPVRERSVDSLVGLAEAGIAASGWEEVSLISLSTSDYCGLERLVERLAEAFDGRHVSISLPSMRPGTFSREIARMIARTKKTGLTFAPEAGSDRLRRTINKNIDQGELYSTVETAFRGGWDSVKLYFMLGLPGEDAEDIRGLIEMVKSVGSICRGFGKRRHATVSLSPFVPRPWTPFQWESQRLPEDLLRTINFIRRSLPDDRINLKWRDPRMSLVEGLLARGDRRVGGVILAAWKSGLRFDGWTDRFDFARWISCFEGQGIEAGEAARAREVGEPLPWDYIVGGVSTEFLTAEAARASAGTLTPDCREGHCSDCGACPGPSDEARTKEAPPDPVRPVERSGPVRAGAPQTAFKLRVKYAKDDQIRFTSHLDVTRSIQRSLRRVRIPVCYSEGFSPHPRISFGPPLPLGVVGEAEYLDMAVSSKPREGWLEELNSVLPSGLRVLEARMVPAQGPSLMTMINAAGYEVTVWECDRQTELALVDSIRHDLSEAGILRISGGGSDVECRLQILARLKLDSGAPEKVIVGVLRRLGKPFKLVRKGLYLEKDGTLYSPFGEIVKG